MAGSLRWGKSRGCGTLAKEIEPPLPPDLDVETLFGRAFLTIPIAAAITRLADGRIVAVNDRWCRLFGFERAEAVGSTLPGLGIIDPAVRARLAAQGAKAGYLDLPDLVLFTKSRQERHVAASVRMMGWGGQTFAVFTLADETELVATAAALRRAHDEVLAAEAARLRLLSAVAHDLASPLTLIGINLETIDLAAESVGEEFKKPLRAIARNVHYLAMLTHDLREFAKLREGRFVLRKAPLDLSAVIRETLEAMEVVFQERNLELHSELPPSVPIQADPLRVPQVMFNLLGNAAKFTPHGGVVAVSCHRDSDSVTVRVRDSGLGMDEDRRANLFLPFSQVHDVTPTDAGMGLGLFICKQIVDRHGGRIWAESEGIGQGSSFCFSLPA